MRCILCSQRHITMISLVLLMVVGAVVGDGCYWNAECPFPLYSTKTPYDTIRGDIRDHPTPQGCEAISIWTLNRHGNRNPGGSVTEAVNELQARLKSQIIEAYDAGRSQLCAQDIQEFRKWTWNETMEVSQSFLTGTGYEELYDMALRIKEKYPQLLSGGDDKYYFRPTNEQRTVTSAIAFVHGITENTNLNVTIDGPWTRDDIIRPYENCDRYQELVKGGQNLVDEIEAYSQTSEYVAVQRAVQSRLGITSQLSVDDIYNLYEICRFFRSWTPNLQSPWCSVFSDEDLVVLEYRDDVRHYHRNGYGSWVNVNLGGPPLKNLYESFEAAVNGTGRNIVSYFTHDTMLEMAFCAMELFKDPSPIRGATRDENRLWKTSNIAAFSTNFIAVLNKCQESGSTTHRVQFFINEKVTTLCPAEGCTWQEFVTKFQPFTESNLEFCSMTYKVPDPPEPVTDSAAVSKAFLGLLLLIQGVFLAL